MKKVLLLFIFQVVPFWMVAQQFKMNAYKPDDVFNPLPSAAVWDMEQDDLGRMWFGIIGGGLVYYDNTKFHAFGEDEGYPYFNTIYGIEKGFDNDLWVIASNQLVRVALPKSHFFKIDTLNIDFKLPLNEQDSLSLFQGYTQAYGEETFAIDHEKKQVWVATAQFGLIRYQKNTSGFWTADTLKPSDYSNGTSQNDDDVRAVFLRKNGSLVFTTSSGAFYNLNTDSQVESPLSQLKNPPTKLDLSFLNPTETWINAITEDRFERLLVSTAKGDLWYLDGDLSRINSEEIQKSALKFFELGQAIQEIKIDNKNQIWVGSDKGLFIINPEKRNTIIPKGVDKSATLSLFYDVEGNMWAGSYQGLYKFQEDYNQFVLYTIDDERFQSEEVLSIATSKTDESTFWLGTSHGLAYYDLDESNYPYELVNEVSGLSSNTVFDVLEDSDGIVWLATLRGISSITKEGYSPLKAQSNKISRTKLGWLTALRTRGTFLAVREIKLADTNEKVILFPGYNGLVILFRGRFYAFAKPIEESGIAFNDVFQIGDRWILGAENFGMALSKTAMNATTLLKLTKNAQKNDFGFFEIKEVAFSKVELDEPYKSVFISDFTQSSDSVFWVSSSIGLISFSTNDIINSTFKVFKPIQTFGKENGLPVQSVTGIEYEQHHLYLFSNKGIGELSLKDMKLSRWFSKKEGMQDEFTWRSSGSLVKNGVAYSGTGKGLVKVDFLSNSSKQAHTVVFNQIQEITNENGENRYTFNFRLNSYADEFQQQFSYRLLPYETDFSTTNSNSVSYTNLRAFLFSKEYEFEVHDGNFKKEQAAINRYSITVHPTWYLSWWFLGTSILLIVGFTYIFYKQKIIQLKKVQEERAEQKQFETVQRIGASIAHDLKNSIFSLSLLSSNLEKRFDNPAFRKDAIETLESTLDHMNTLVFRLQQRQESWKVEKKKQDLVCTINQSLKRIQLNDFQELSLKTELPKELIWEHDSISIQRVVENLIWNAIDACQKKGSIQVTLQKTSQACEIHVIDNGQGMSDEFIKSKLFKPFITTKENGVGLGLFTCQEVIRAHGGELSVKSELGKGSHFIITI